MNEILRTINFHDDPCNLSSYIKKRVEKTDLHTVNNDGHDSISPALFSQLRQCQPTSTLVERSISILKKILSHDRHFLPENVKKYLILKFNALQRFS